MTAEDTAQQNLEDLRALLNLPQGKRFLSRMLFEWTHVLANSFTGNSSTFFNEGERNIGLKLFAELGRADPNFYQKLLEVNKHV